jgi:hypothetical protein
MDAVMLAVAGDLLKDATWRAVVQRVIEQSDGRALNGVQHSDEVLEGEDAKRVEQWADALVMASRRAEEAQRASP